MLGWRSLSTVWPHFWTIKSQELHGSPDSCCYQCLQLYHQLSCVKPSFFRRQVSFRNYSPFPGSFHILCRKRMTGRSLGYSLTLKMPAELRLGLGLDLKRPPASNSTPFPDPLPSSLSSFSWENLILGSGSLSGRIQLKKINRGVPVDFHIHCPASCLVLQSHWATPRGTAEL